MLSRRGLVILIVALLCCAFLAESAAASKSSKKAQAASKAAPKAQAAQQAKPAPTVVQAKQANAKKPVSIQKVDVKTTPNNKGRKLLNAFTMGPTPAFTPGCQLTARCPRPADPTIPALWFQQNGGAIIWRQSFFPAISGHLCNVFLDCTSSNMQLTVKLTDAVGNVLDTSLPVTCGAIRDNQWETAVFPGQHFITAGTKYYLVVDGGIPNPANGGGPTSIRTSSSDSSCNPHGYFEYTVDPSDPTSWAGFGGNGRAFKMLFYVYVRVDTPSTSGDPHFVGFHGQAFDFAGEGGQVFNLISGKDVQVNGLFVAPNKENPGQTVISELGIKYQGQRVHMKADGSVTVNGKPITPNQAGKAQLPWMSYEQATGLAQLSLPKNLEQRFYGKNGVQHEQSHKLRLTFGKFQVDVMAVEAKNWIQGLKFLDLAVKATHDHESLNKLDLHGVLGQTARYTGAQAVKHFRVAGKDSDYKVRSGGLFGDQFKFNKFAAAPKSNTNTNTKKA